MDDTIAPSLYRTGKGDRAIPLGLGLASLGVVPFLSWASGPLFWPWGAGASALALVSAAVSFFRWWSSRGTVHWSEETGVLTVRRGRRSFSVAAADLDAVEIRPSAARTTLTAGPRRVVLPHRLVRFERLLDRLRAARPDLFPPPEGRLVLRAPWTDLGILIVLAAGTGTAGFLLAPWQPVVGGLFVCGALGVLTRALWSVPRSFEVTEGRLTVVFLVRRKIWRQPTAVREGGYSAGGAVFFQMRLEYGSRTVVLDEGDLTTPLRPWAGWVVHQLSQTPAR